MLPWIQFAKRLNDDFLADRTAVCSCKLQRARCIVGSWHDVVCLSVSLSVCLCVTLESV